MQKSMQKARHRRPFLHTKALKIASRWDFCTPESYSYGLCSKCTDLSELLLWGIKFVARQSPNIHASTPKASCGWLLGSLPAEIKLICCNLVHYNKIVARPCCNVNSYIEFFLRFSDTLCMHAKAKNSHIPFMMGI